MLGGKLARFAVLMTVMPMVFLAPPARGGTQASSNINAYVGHFEGQTTHNLTRPAATTIAATFSSAAGTDGVPLELWADTYNTDWHELPVTLTTNNLGKVSLSVAPKHSTKYQFRFAGDVTRAPSVSVVLTIGVHSKVTLRLNDASLRIGQTLVARGAVYPPRPGKSATLWRFGAVGWTKLATGTIRTDGTYRITKAFGRSGPRSLVVTVPATVRNLKGTSPARTVNVG